MKSVEALKREPLKRCCAGSSASTLQRFNASAKIAGTVACALLCSFTASRAQPAFSDQTAVHSVSGQFIVSSIPDDSPFPRDPAIVANTNLLHLEPALLAVAAERFKLTLWDQLGIKPGASWSGKIFIVIHSARSANETVAITSNPFLDHWNYRVDFPDALMKSRYVRALSAVLLLEIANRTARGGHPAEVPPWLVDGLAQQVVSVDPEKVLLSKPSKKSGDPLPIRREMVRHNLDPLASAREILQTRPVLTFDELSWPADEQMNGYDGGAYFAGAQLFQSELLRLKNGPEKMRAFLAELPAHLNWQTAFFIGFREHFQHPLDVEKWWALRVVNFAARTPGPQWTVEASRLRMAELMSVPVEFRSDSNALPSHAEISLQAAMKSLGDGQRDMVARVKVRDFSLVELRMSPPFNELADGYRQALADFLGEQKKPAPAPVYDWHTPPMVAYKATLEETLRKLDDLDRRRREAEMRAVIPLPDNAKKIAP